jgi:uncharacterized LabA/DUF88 family protein
MRTNVYIDGFNLYYGSLRGTAYKWLDLAALCRNALAKHHVINRIRYFTALTKSTASNPQQHVRQQAYLRALKTIPNLSVHLGSFQSNVCKRPRASDGVLVEVLDTKEKGSDVNLASYLLLDGFNKDYEAAVVVSNDSDLTEPIRLVRHDLKLVVGILNPHANHAYELKKIPPKFHVKITSGHLAASQLPPTLTDANGTVHKPSRW